MRKLCSLTCDVNNGKKRAKHRQPCRRLRNTLSSRSDTTEYVVILAGRSRDIESRQALSDARTIPSYANNCFDRDVEKMVESHPRYYAILVLPYSIYCEVTIPRRLKVLQYKSLFLTFSSGFPGLVTASSFVFIPSDRGYDPNEKKFLPRFHQSTFRDVTDTTTCPTIHPKLLNHAEP
jgi:hypothetical protein